MKPHKAEQIRRVRLAARHLHTLAHVKACRCCQIDADVIETFADAPYAPTWLAHVAKRIQDVSAEPPTKPPEST